MFEVCHCEQPLIRCDHRGCRCTLCGKPENRAARVTSPPMNAPAPTDAGALREALVSAEDLDELAATLADAMAVSREAGWSDKRIASQIAHGLVAPMLAQAVKTAIAEFEEARATTTDADLARALDENSRLKADKALLLKVIDAGKCEAAFAYADEADGSATAATRRIRLTSIRDALNGVGDIEARKALGLLAETINAEPSQDALTLESGHVE